MTFREAMDIFFKDEDDSFVFNSSSLRKKHRFLARKYHPDTTLNIKADEKFKELQDALIIIKKNLILYNDDYDKLWKSYKEKDEFISQHGNNSNSVGGSFDSSIYEVPDNISKMITSILSSIFILKGYIYKKYKNFDFPDDEYLADYLIRFEYPDKYNLEVESMNLKSFMNSLCKELNRIFKIDFYINPDISNYGVYEFYQNLESIWERLVLYDKTMHNSKTKEDIRDDCRVLANRIKVIVDSTGSFIDKIRINRLLLLIESRNINLNGILSEIYYFLNRYKLYVNSDDIYRNNRQVIKNFTSSNLPEISKMVSEWQEHIDINGLSVYKK